MSSWARIVEDLHPVFPPFQWNSSSLARMLVEGEMREYSELLSINGHAILHAQADGDSVGVEILKSDAPVSWDGGRREWLVVSERFLANAQRVLGREGWAIERRGPALVLRYTAPAGRGSERGIAEAIGVARRIAGLTPYVGPLTEMGYVRLGGEESSESFEQALMVYVGVEVYSLYDTLGLEGLVEALVSNGLVIALDEDVVDEKGVIRLDLLSEISELSRATVSRLLRRAWEAGLLVRCRVSEFASLRRSVWRYFANLRSEVIVEYLFTVTQEDGDAESVPQTRDVACALLPYLEGVRHADWHNYPGPYRVCKPVSESLREVEAGIPESTLECEVRGWPAGG